MALQAFLDDSGSDTTNNVFLLAGYIAPTEQWAAFADEWRAALDKSPGASYFKAAEAMHLRGEFSVGKGWDRSSRDERVAELAEIIRRRCTVALSGVIQHSDWRETIQTLPSFGASTLALEHPYVFLWYQILSELWLDAQRLNLGEGPCDFIFDEQTGFDVEALTFWKNMKAAMSIPPSPPSLAWRGSAPIFRDDKAFLPLQAADMWAWSNRRALTHADNLKLPTEAMDRLCAVPARHLTITRAFLDGQMGRAHDLYRKALAARFGES